MLSEVVEGGNRGFMDLQGQQVMYVDVGEAIHALLASPTPLSQQGSQAHCRKPRRPHNPRDTH